MLLLVSMLIVGCNSEELTPEQEAQLEIELEELSDEELEALAADDENGAIAGHGIAMGGMGGGLGVRAGSPLADVDVSPRVVRAAAKKVTKKRAIKKKRTAKSMKKPKAMTT